MKIAVRYFTKTGNTKKLADAIAEELSVEAKDISAPLTEKADALFLCNSVYLARADGKVKKFISDNKDKIGTVFNVSTAAMIRSTYSQIRKVAEKNSVKLSDKEFHCRGKFAALHSGHPDNEDIKAVRAFAKEAIGDI